MITYYWRPNLTRLQGFFNTCYFIFKLHRSRIIFQTYTFYTCTLLLRGGNIDVSPEAYRLSSGWVDVHNEQVLGGF